MQSIADRVKLHNGVAMPWLGLGVYKAQAGEETEVAVKEALKVGYRSIDTAAFYFNEESVGLAVRQLGLPREEVFVTTKVWNSDQGYDSTLNAFARSQEKLSLGFVDLLLIHWPVPGKYVETWRALEHLYKQGKVRAIGVSNFKIHHLQDILDHGEIVPMVNQVEFHPWLNQVELLEFCRSNKIQLEAWRPLTRGEIFSDPVITGLAEKYQKTPAQIILRWHLEKEVVVIPKSVTPERIRENAAIFDFELSPDDVALIDSLNKDRRLGPDPDHIDF